jgi:hypothetical protein
MGLLDVLNGMARGPRGAGEPAAPGSRDRAIVDSLDRANEEIVQ